MIYKKAFTLVELLVVIAIIAIITSLGVANFITAQKQARDSARREMIGNIQTALEQYYAESSLYPVGDTQINSAFDNGTAPSDPKDSGDYVLSWQTSTTEYCVCAKLETSTGNADLSASTQCTWNSDGQYYCIQNKQ